MRSAIVAHYGEKTYQALQNTKIDIAGGQVVPTQVWERVMSYLRNGVAIAAMAVNLGTMLLQPLGLTQSMVRVGPVYVMKAMLKFFTGAAAMDGTVKRMYELSTFMRLRSKTINREVNEIRNKIGRVGLFGKTHGSLEEAYFYLMVKAQLLADIPTWMGAYEKAQAQNATEEDSVAMADQAVIDSQGSGHIKDLASVQRGGPTKKLFTSFMSYFQTTYNLSTDSIKGTDFKSASSVMRLGVDFLLLYSLPIVIEQYVRGALIRGECDDGKDTECMIAKIGADHLVYPLSGLILAREGVGMLQGFDRYGGPPALNIFNSIGSLKTQTQQIFSIDSNGLAIDTDEIDADFFKALNRAGGPLFHYPSVQMERVIFGMLDLQEGKTDKVTAPFFGYSKQ